MKKEYRVTILVDPKMAIEHSILHESEPVEEHIKEVIRLSISGDFLFKDTGIEIVEVVPVKVKKEKKSKDSGSHPVKGGFQNLEGANWDDDDK